LRARGRTGRQPLQNDARVSEDDHQQVVEFVCDPPGQHTEAFEFLGVLQLQLEVSPFLLGPLTIRDVLKNRHELAGFGAVRAYRDVQFFARVDVEFPCGPARSSSTRGLRKFWVLDQTKPRRMLSDK